MSFRDLIPFRRPSGATQLTPANDPFDSFHREIDRLFDDFWRGGAHMPRFGAMFDRAGFEGKGALQAPKIEVSETESAYTVEAELPGLSEDEVDVHLADGVLTIQGERRQEEEKKNKGVQYTERSYGMFKRTLQVPPDVKEDDIKASFKNGVLHLELPRTAEVAPNARRIEIQKGS